VVDRSRPDDVLQLAVDRGAVPMAIGALLVLDPDHCPPADVVRATLLDRAAAVPRLGQRLARTPPGAGRPVWLDAGPGAMADLVDTVVVQAPADAGGGPVPRRLLDSTADLAMRRLPPDRPLWRARLLLDAHRGGVRGVAIVAHHALADGMGGLAVLAALADGERPSPPPVRPLQALPPWRELAREAWTERLHGIRTTRTATRRLGEGFEGLGARRPRTADPCSLLARSSGRRRLDVCRVELEAVRRVGRANGVTVNALAVTAVTGALVRLLRRRGERVGELVVSVPVSQRGQAEAGAMGNASGVVPVRVPAVADPQQRLAAVADQQDRVRSTRGGGSAAVLTPVFRALAGVGLFQLFVEHQRLVHTFVTNVRGPAERLSLAGSAVTSVVPLALNPGNVTLSFDVLSYAGTLGITVVADPVRVPEADWFAGVLEEELCAVAEVAG
jgi:diacylglycerol O-acyltransferase